MNSPQPAPIAAFAFNRPSHLARTIEALKACPEAQRSHLTLYCDGARGPRDEEAVSAVRGYASTIDGFASVTVDASDTNRGLAASIVRGVSDQLKHSDRVIVLEDDLVVSPHFLRYMNDGLSHYADDPRVASIHGYVYPTGCALPETFFLEGADCWGWGTWARAWSHFEADGSKLLAELERRKLTRRFDFDGSFPYTQMLRDQIAGRNNSWAIRWHAACYLKGFLTLYPARSLVRNIGHDSSGTHCGTTDVLDAQVTEDPITVSSIPVEPSAIVHRAFAHFLAGQLSWRQRVRMTLSHVLNAAR